MRKDTLKVDEKPVCSPKRLKEVEIEDTKPALSYVETVAGPRGAERVKLGAEKVLAYGALRQWNSRARVTFFLKKKFPCLA